MTDTITREAAGAGTECETRPDLDGLLVRIPGQPAIWLITQGYRRLVPSMDVFNRLFKPGATITSDINADDICEGSPLSDYAVLVSNAGTVYLVTNGQKLAITSGGFSRYQFNSNKVVAASPPVLLVLLPDGPAITWPQ